MSSPLHAVAIGRSGTWCRWGPHGKGVSDGVQEVAFEVFPIFHHVAGVDAVGAASGDVDILPCALAVYPRE